MVDDLVGRFAAVMPSPNPPPSRCVFRPEGGPVPDDSVPRLFGGFRIGALVDVADDPGGILCAMGDWTNGFALYVRSGQLVFAVNRTGDLRLVEGSAAVPPGLHMLTCHYSMADGRPAVTLLHDDDVVASAHLDVPIPMFWQHGGTALCLGHDRGFPVSDDYEVPFEWNGVLHELVVEVGRELPPDPGTELRVALAAE